MPLSHDDRREVEEIVLSHIRPSAEVLEQMRATQETLAKTAERLSIVVVGDEQLGFKGLTERMSIIERERQAEKMSLAKLLGWAAGAGTVIAVVFKLLAVLWGKS